MKKILFLLVITTITNLQAMEDFPNNLVKQLQGIINTRYPFPARRFELTFGRGKTIVPGQYNPVIAAIFAAIKIVNYTYSKKITAGELMIRPSTKHDPYARVIGTLNSPEGFDENIFASFDRTIIQELIKGRIITEGEAVTTSVKMIAKL